VRERQLGQDFQVRAMGSRKLGQDNLYRTTVGGTIRSGIHKHVFAENLEIFAKCYSQMWITHPAIDF
jgi:hypothetical protein